MTGVRIILLNENIKEPGAFFSPGSFIFNLEEVV
jgi:hypothetical protein